MDDEEIEITDADVDVPLADLVKNDRRRVKIMDMGDYSDIFYAIESTILDYWAFHPQLKDRDVIKAFNELIRDFDNLKEGTLACEISKEVKAVLVWRRRNNQKDYTYGEIISCLSLLRKLAKIHRSSDGIGYLKWIKAFFEDRLPETEEEIIEYILENEL